MAKMGEFKKRDEGYWPKVGMPQLRRLLEKGIKEHNKVPERDTLVSNIGYSIQYLEMLNKKSLERNHSVIQTMITKSFIVTGCGIVEAILYYLVIVNDLEKYEQWEEIDQKESNGLKGLHDDVKVLVVTKKKRSAPVREDLTFNKLAQKVKAKDTIGDFDMYKELSFLRKLRNYVHLYPESSEKMTDFKTFDNRHIDSMKKVLHDILTSKLFSPDEKDLESIDFLKVENAPELKDI